MALFRDCWSLKEKRRHYKKEQFKIWGSVSFLSWITENCPAFLFPLSFFFGQLECLMQGNIFNLVATLQGRILALVYPWYTNTENGKKDKINSIPHTIIFHIPYAQYTCRYHYKERRHERITGGRIVHLFFHGQVVSGKGTKLQKAYFLRLDKMTI